MTIFGIWQTTTATSGWYGEANSPPFYGSERSMHALIEAARTCPMCHRVSAGTYEVRPITEKEIEEAAWKARACAADGSRWRLP